MLGYRLARHIEPFAELIQSLAVFLKEPIEQFAAALAGLMQQAGWKLRWPQLLVQDKEAPGVWVMVHREADAPQCAKVLLASLNAVGIEARGVEVTALAAGTFDLLVGMP